MPDYPLLFFIFCLLFHIEIIYSYISAGGDCDIVKHEITWLIVTESLDPLHQTMMKNEADGVVSPILHKNAIPVI